jgi:hypothetical protein
VCAAKLMVLGNSTNARVEDLCRLLDKVGWIFCFCKDIEVEASEAEQPSFLMQVVRFLSEYLPRWGWRSLSLDWMLLKGRNGFASF